MKPHSFFGSPLLAAFGALLMSCVPAPMTSLGEPPQAVLSAADLNKVGHRIWQNECAGTVAGLTSWNDGEEFASLGIGHFIWYPAGYEGPFEESFPSLVTFCQSRGVTVPSWLASTPDCPWGSRAAFNGDRDGQRQQDLRNWLAGCVPVQTAFILARLEAAAPALTAGSAKARAHFTALRQSAAGCYAMIDYINFKGDGLKATERYAGQGWGLAQVLAGMAGPTTAAFAASAKQVLAQRVANAPKARGEQRWLKGWHSRCDGYGRAF
jgi:hypothetical protein